MSMPSSMIADAHAVARRGDAAVEPAPDRRRADDRGHAVGLRAVGHRRARRAARPARPRAGQLAARQRTTSASMTCACARSRAVREPRASSRSSAACCSRASAASARRGPRRWRSTCPRASRSWASGARSETGGARSSTTTSARDEAAIRGRSGEGQQRTERDEQGTRWQPHRSRVPRNRHFDTGPVQAIEHVRRRRWPGGRRGWSKSSASSCVMPIRRMTACERTFCRRRERDELLEAERRRTRGARSRAPPRSRSPAPVLGARRQPISTQGVKCASKAGTTRPTKPMNGATPGTSTAQGPKPWRREVLLASAARARRSARAAAAPACAPSRADRR